MYVSQRKNRDGKIYYSISYTTKDGRRTRLRKDQHPHFETADEALAWAKSQDAIKSARQAYIESKVAWRTKHYEFDVLLKRYESWQRQQAPNSWKSCIYYLERWIYPFYLQEKKSSNVNDWHLHFREFVDWLQRDDAFVRKGRKSKLAGSTVNKIVATLNTFLICLSEYNLIDKDAAKKCPALSERYLNKRGFDDLISEVERDQIYAELSKSKQAIADFFYVLWHTGMRFSELFSLPMSAFFLGDVPAGALKSEISRNDLGNCLGYIYLDSQVVDDARIRASDGSISRKPLKSCPAISSKYARTIPIFDIEVLKILGRRYLLQQEIFNCKKWGADKKNYLLFDDINLSQAVNGLREAFLRCGLPPKSFHCCRHTYTTKLVGQTGSYVLARMITGHKSQSAFERYVHIYEEVGIESKQNEQNITIASLASFLSVDV